MTLALEQLYPKDKVVIREVGLRDGLQLVRQYPGTEAKRAWLDVEYHAGLRNFEIGSFLPQARYPQFADTEELIAHVRSKAAAASSALVLNHVGGTRALESNVDEIICVVSASEAHNMANARRSIDATLGEIERLLAARQASNRRPVVAVAIAMAFGCSISGKNSVATADVLRIAERCLRAGADVLSIADTVGYASPSDVRARVKAVVRAFPATPVICHFHDTRGLGLANAAAALDEGVRILDASLGGLGGCPFAPGATGNIVLEDTIFLAQSMGFDVPIDIEALRPARQIAEDAMPSEQFYGHVLKAGLPRMAGTSA